MNLLKNKRVVVGLVLIAFLGIGCQILEKNTNKKIQDLKVIDKFGKGKNLRIVAASCAKIQQKGNEKQPAWHHILKQKPDVLLLLGDIVYLDGKKHKPCKGQKNKEDYFKCLFKKQWEEENFDKLRNKVPYFGTWDDHDAGVNNIHGGDVKEGTKNHKKLMLARRNFIDYMFNSGETYPNFVGDSSINNIRLGIKNDIKKREKKAIGPIYYSFNLPLKKYKNIHFIMLDTISSRSKDNKVVIGKDQKEWLTKELDDHSEKIKFVCGGASLDRGKNGWRRGFKKSYLDMVELLNSKEKVVYLSGDVHYNTTIVPGRNRSKKIVTSFPEIISSSVARDSNYNYVVIDVDLDNEMIRVQHYGNDVQGSRGQIFNLKQPSFIEEHENGFIANKN